MHVEPRLQLSFSFFHTEVRVELDARSEKIRVRVLPKTIAMGKFLLVMQVGKCRSMPQRLQLVCYTL